MKIISTKGLYNMRPVSGSAEWYWCCDYVSGDLYEAEELYQDGHPIKQNRLLFLHYPDGHTVEPIVAHEGQYFGAPGFENGRLQILMADFPAGKIYVFQYNPTPEQLTLRAELSRSAIKDCYNLMFQQSPLMLVRQSFEKRLQFLWPETAEFEIGNTETFYSREGDNLYFTRWFEDPDYREETVIRRWPTGEIAEVIPGTLMEFPDGQRWVLQ